MRNALVSIVCFLMALGSSATPWAWDRSWSEASSSGKTAANQVLPKVNKGGKITSRFSNPLTSDASPLYTFDDNTGFNAQLTAPSSNAFVDLFIAPSATGDLTTVTVKQDTDFDGTFDYAYSLSSPVSGVCANGFISADPGTWNNLHYYTWTADTSGRVTVTDAVSMAALAGCYCINSSCGSNLVWANVDIVLKDLGGGIVSAIQQQRPVTITSTDITGTEILYYGQESSSMGNTTGVYSSGTAHPEQYYAGGGGTLPADDEVLNQTGDPNSFYYQLNTLNDTIGNNLNVVQCDITRNVTLEDTIEPLAGTGLVTVSGNQFNVILGRVGDNYWCAHCSIFEEYYDLFIHHPENVISATIIRAKWDDWMRIYLNDQLVWCGPNCSAFPPEIPGTCELHTSWDWNLSQDVSSYFKTYGPLNTKIRVAVAGCGEGFGYIRVQVSDLCGITDSITNNCSSLEANDDCTLRDEEVDGVYTYRNYAPTGLNPISSCKTFLDQICQKQACKDWWKITRTYVCQGHTTYDFTAVQQRAEHIQDTFNDGDTDLTFQDYIPDSRDTPDYDITLPPREDVERCEKSCRVRVPVKDTQASVAGHTAMWRDTINTFKEVLKPCDGDTCPVGPGETLIEGCQCTNYFVQTTSILQVMDDASKDIICSSSPPQ